MGAIINTQPPTTWDRLGRGRTIVGTWSLAGDTIIYPSAKSFLLELESGARATVMATTRRVKSLRPKSGMRRLDWITSLPGTTHQPKDASPVLMNFREAHLRCLFLEAEARRNKRCLTLISLIHNQSISISSHTTIHSAMWILMGMMPMMPIPILKIKMVKGSTFKSKELSRPQALLQVVWVIQFA